MKRKRKLFGLLLINFFILTSFIQAKETCVTLQKGDTLFKIAKEYDIPVKILIKYNNITDTKKVKEGTKIKIPVIYIVKKGDTLYGIARLYKISVDDIVEYNSISDIKKIKVGLKLIIPVSDTTIDNSTDSKDMITSGDSEKPVEDPGLLWPHTGKRERLDGKLKGLVIRGKEGDTIISVSTGKVIWAEAYRGYGKMVLVKSTDNYIYIYAGNEKLFVGLGEDIKVSTPIGRLGKNPHDGIPRVYFCVYRNGKPLDPYKAPRM